MTEPALFVDGLLRRYGRETVLDSGRLGSGF